MGLSTKVSSDLKARFSIHNIPLALLERIGKSYSLTYQVKGYKFIINLMGNHFNFIKNCRTKKNKKRARNLAPFFITRNDDETIDLGIQINDISQVAAHDFTKGPLFIKNKHEDRGSYIIEIKYPPVDLINKIKQIQRRESEKLRKKEERKELLDKLLKKFDEYEVKYRDSSIQQEQDLKSKGIYLARPNAFKRCENCANNSGSKCSVHKVEVSDNHRCSRFYSYKTFYGGGFSPK
ncbi:hypothetical protein M3182_00615 [Mesobacillus maritimus]|uniref:hypothetical protein n=1 Tax=Mesobacillus maritimus TaxID=1643336 RepID=UPI00203A802C|nr:hypothetical protein [Mesobacillus maritimus]MCM3584241.1 hypothetical protein [Mesobacillus maritimus]